MISVPDRNKINPFHSIGKMGYILMELDVTKRKLVRNIRKLHDCTGYMSIIRLKRLNLQ